MGTLLDVATLKDWREIVASTVAAAKSGENYARAFLAQYLVGHPDLNAPAPVTAVVQQASECDPVIENHAHPHIERLRSPAIQSDDDVRDTVNNPVAEELRALEAKKPTALQARDGSRGSDALSALKRRAVRSPDAAIIARRAT